LVEFGEFPTDGMEATTMAAICGVPPFYSQSDILVPL
jgi:hypothetical protein